MFYNKFTTLSINAAANLVDIAVNIGDKLFEKLPDFFDTYELNNLDSQKFE